MRCGTVFREGGLLGIAVSAASGPVGSASSARSASRRGSSNSPMRSARRLASSVAFAQPGGIDHDARVGMTASACSASASSQIKSKYWQI